MEFRDYVRMLQRGWLAVLLCTAGVLAMAFAYVTLTPRTYQTSSLIYVSVAGRSSVADLNTANQFSAASVQSYAEIAASPTVLKQVVKNLRLPVTDDALARRVDVKVLEDTTLLQVTARASEDREAARLANAVADVAIGVIGDLESKGRASVKNQVRLEQVVTAEVPRIAIAPNVRRTMALGLIIGLSLGVAVMILVQTVDTRIRDARALWKLTRTPMLAAIPPVRRSRSSALVVRDEPGGPVGEAYRTLRTNLRFLEQPNHHSLVVASAAEHRRAPSAAANLAWALADVGQRVVLVDADLRHPSIAALLGVPNDPGLSSVLAGHLDLVGSLVTTNHATLTVLPAGPPSAQPSELIGSLALGRVLGRLESQFDHVVIAAPPVLTYSDAAVLASHAQRTLVTVVGGRTRTTQLSAALGRLEQAGVTTTGIVLTQIRHGANREEFIRPPDARPAAVGRDRDPGGRVNGLAPTRAVT